MVPELSRILIADWHQTVPVAVKAPALFLTAALLIGSWSGVAPTATTATQSYGVAGGVGAKRARGGGVGLDPEHRRRRPWLAAALDGCLACDAG